MCPWLNHRMKNSVVTGLKWMSTFWLPIICHKCELPFHCIIEGPPPQSVWLICLLHCSVFHFSYKQSTFIVWFWSFSRVYESGLNVEFFFMYSVWISLEITDYSYFLCLFAQKKRSTSAMMGPGISNRAKQYSPPPVAVSGFVLNLNYGCHNCLILGTCM